MKLVAKKKFYKDISDIDPIKDHQKIVRILSREFSYEAALSFDIGFLRSLASDNVSELLDKTRQLKCHSQKRYDDTYILISQLTLHGYDSDSGRLALQRINSIHQRFKISNDDYLFVLSIYAFELLDWLDQHCWRKISVKERLAWLIFWQQIGNRMGIQNIPHTESSFRDFVRLYEDKHVKYFDRNLQLANAYLNTLSGRYRLFKPISKWIVLYYLPENYRKALGLPRLSRLTKIFVFVYSKLRQIFNKLSPFIALYTTDKSYHTYPKGYKIEQLGPT